MTKKVRVENADISGFDVVVETWARGVDGAPDALQDTRALTHPCALDDFFIHSHRYLVVKEAAAKMDPV